MENKEKAIQNDNEFINKKIKSVPKPKINKVGMDEVGVATKIIKHAKAEKDNDMVNATASTLDLSVLNEFTNISNQRDRLYTALENMADDPTISAALEIYAEDSTEANENGKLVWATSDDDGTSKYVNFLIDSLQINKNIYKWAYSLCTYGDIYIETFRNSEIKDNDTDDKTLNESVNVNVFDNEDPLAHYIEMYPNPAELFELTRFGKTAGFIKTDTPSLSKNYNETSSFNFQYKFRQGDINVYDPKKFVHACLDDNNTRVPEKVEIFKDDDKTATKSNTYIVKRGKSLFYNVYKIWRIMSLLESSMLLNRLTKSSILRIIQVEVGDMPKEDATTYLNSLKATMEQKIALDVGNAMSEYNNPGPIINNMYVPVRGTQGQITTSEVGGEINVGNLPDVEFINNKFYGAIRIPKQFLGFTEDNAGFNGGTSLALISSRYAKSVKRIQAVLKQLVTDIINIFLIDKKQETYLGNFTIQMQAPITQEEVDRRDSDVNRVSIVRDLMDVLDIQTPATKLTLAKSLLSGILNSSDAVSIINEEIERLEKEQQDNNPQEEISSDTEHSEMSPHNDSTPLNLDRDLGLNLPTEEPSEESTEQESEATLPTPEELGIGDLTNNNSEE